MKISSFHLSFLTMASMCFGAQGASAESGFLQGVSSLNPSIRLSAASEDFKIFPDKKKMIRRLKNGVDDPKIEPLRVNIIPVKKRINSLAKKIAKDGKYKKARDLIFVKLEKTAFDKRYPQRKSLVFEKSDFKTIDIYKLREHYSATQKRLTISPSVAGNAQKIRSLWGQADGFIRDDRKQRSLLRKIDRNQPIDVGSLLLPKFAERANGKYTQYQGPNCFHAALSFAAPGLAKSNRVNIRREKNHHPAMINYDELWFALRNNFYEVDPELSDLKYGDLLIFFDYVPGKPVQYKWIKHASVYLFGPYTFSKGSKSAYSPYTFKTFNVEWATWDRLTSKLGLKVYRRKIDTARKYPLPRLRDWIY